jgi:16S rRNA (uracil1498-N3)-methyltransferase
MVEHSHRSGVVRFVVDQPVVLGDITLHEAAAHHAHVRRLGVGDRVAITDGLGHRGFGRVASLEKKQLVALIDGVELLAAPPPIHLFLPVADRDRMLWLAEKSAELQVTSWNPVMFRRSRSVVPRGDGEGFERKVRARMIAALEQSGGAWLPTMEPIREAASVPRASDGRAYALDRGGPSLGRVPMEAPISLMVGPEGGYDADELATVRRRDWTTASLGDLTLRFETAAVAAVAVARARLAPEHEG